MLQHKQNHQYTLELSDYFYGRLYSLVGEASIQWKSCMQSPNVLSASPADHLFQAGNRLRSQGIKQRVGTARLCEVIERIYVSSIKYFGPPKVPTCVSKPKFFSGGL